MTRSMIKYRVSFLLLFCLAVASSLLSLNAYRQLDKAQPVTAFQNVGSLRASDYDQMLRSEAQAKEPLRFALWSQTDGARVEGIGTDRTEDVAWLAVTGNTRLLLPAMETLDDEDTDGCLIDRATSKELFRDENAVGSTVELGGIEYTVRGVIASPDRTVVTRPEAGHSLTNITVAGTKDTEAFLMRHSLSSSVTVKSSLYVAVARTFSLLPVLAAILCALLLLGWLRGGWAGYPVRQLTASVVMLAVGTAGLMLLFTVIPDALIPSQWSDFGFWETSGREFFRDVTDFLSAAKLRPDLVWMVGVLQSALGILGAHFVFCLYNLFRIQQGRAVVTYQVVQERSELVGDAKQTLLTEAAEEQ